MAGNGLPRPWLHETSIQTVGHLSCGLYIALMYVECWLCNAYARPLELRPGDLREGCGMSSVEEHFTHNVNLLVRKYVYLDFRLVC
jgi:hypothetical protein